MELAFKKVDVTGCSLALKTSLFTEETVECIVPDACPDILRILKTETVLCVKSKEVKEGRLEIRGTIQAQILYLPEGTGGVCRMEVSLPFSVSSDHTAIRGDGGIFVEPRTVLADTRILNPRKVYVRAEAELSVSCYAPFSKSMVTGYDGGPELGVQEKCESVTFCGVKMLQNKLFSCAEELSLPGNKPDLEKLLSYRVELNCTEHKIIGSRLIFKGMTRLELLYESEGGHLVPAVFELPFSQMMEVADVEEDAECELCVVPTEVLCRGNREEPRTVAISIGYLAQAVVWQRQKLEVLSDLYSTQRECALSMLSEEFCHHRGSEIITKNVREMVELPMQAGQVLETYVTVGNPSCRLEGNELKLSSTLRIFILYLGEDGEYYFLSAPLTVEAQTAGEQGCTYFPECRCVGERYATPASTGAEIRLTVEFICKTERCGQIDMVSSAHLEEEGEEQGVRPSVILRLAGAKESLWDIAKAYSTTKQAILEANELSGQEEIAGKMLLIPKKR